MIEQKRSLGVKLISVFLFLQFIYGAYKVMPLFARTFNYARFVSYWPLFALLLLLLISAIGVFMQKRWAIVIFWAYVLAPIVFGWYKLVVLMGGYPLAMANTAIVTFLSLMYWRRFGIKE